MLELPALLDWLAAAISNGANIYSALALLVQVSDSNVAQSFARLVRKIELGQSFEDALNELQVELPSPVIAEFCNRVSISLQRGTPLASQLRNLAASTRNQLGIALLSRAASNEIKMLLPLVFLILPVTVWLAIFPSLQYLQLGF